MRLTIRDLQRMKASGERIAMLTAYDATSARLSEAAGVPALLVGDSLGMVIQGHDSTIPVTLEQMIYHASIVTRVTQRPLVVGDLPFMTYGISPEQALASAARLMQEAGVGAVKLEGGAFIAPAIARLTENGIPVMAHLGLTPQSVNQFGGYRVQGRDVDAAQRLLRDAEAVQDAGAFAVVLELVTTPVAQMVTERLRIPTIGIGAGPGCDGQVQVFHDILALYDALMPRHSKPYAQAGEVIRQGIAEYVREVQTGAFPTAAHSFAMPDEAAAALHAEAQPHADS
ncbi:MAG: 3-methyl-2-oxobutanoate hydroxymethyltransferase [Chloroflexota bacterium]|nr:MAG: 3-methyl-2-oxobutanoate hydroxymethyltransferase [Chloroflexota bacterium]